MRFLERVVCRFLFRFPKCTIPVWTALITGSPRGRLSQ